MKEFFKRWRRKIGVLTLLLACVFAAGWVRSFGTAESLNSQTGQFVSFKGVLFFEIFRRPIDLHFSYQSVDAKVKGWWHDSYNELSFWKWRMFGFAYGSRDVAFIDKNGNDSAMKVVHLNCPYWSIVVPLTLLSAWLLLGKPRVAKPKAGPTRS